MQPVPYSLVPLVASLPRRASCVRGCPQSVRAALSRDVRGCPQSVRAALSRDATRWAWLVPRSVVTRATLASVYTGL